MALITLSDAQNLKDPVNAWSWVAKLTIPDITVDLQTTLSTNFSVIDSIKIQDIILPFSQLEVRPRYRGGGNLYFPGDSNIGACTITFMDDQNFTLLQTLLAWQKQVRSPSSKSLSLGNYNVPKNYEGQITVEYYNNSGNLILTVTLYGAWPSAVQDWSLNYTSFHNLPIICTFAVNSVDYTFSSGVKIPTNSPNYSNISNSNSSDWSIPGETSNPDGTSTPTS